MKIPKLSLSLGIFDLAVEGRLNAWEEKDICRRMWDKDGTVWVADPVEAANTPELTNRLGWLTVVKEMRNEADNLMQFASGIKDAGFKDVVLLGMGGASLAAEVLMNTFGNAPDYPPLTVLDSTNPQAIQAVSQRIDPRYTIFIVSSKSGRTLETLSLFEYFYELVKKVRLNNPGRNFIAITDPGSPLEKLAQEREFRRVFASSRNVAGRYGALTYVGLVPAALIGLDISKLLKRAQIMVDACGPNVSAPHHPALALGAALGELALAARNKLTFLVSPEVASFAPWAEQLIAESTGKRDVCIVPVTNEPLTIPASYRQDRVFVCMCFKDNPGNLLNKEIETLKSAGHPVIEICLTDELDIVQEFFRWEMAIAATGIIMNINPFDQPNVESAKCKTRELMSVYQKSGQIPVETPTLVEDTVELYGAVGQATTLPNGLKNFLGQARGDDYLTLMAYLPMLPEVQEAINTLRLTLRHRLKLATTVGYGPRFLHSTGQLHKGGKNQGLFIQLTHTPTPDLPIPGQPYTFGVLIAAQAQGDYHTLLERNRRVIRVHFTGDVVDGIGWLSRLIQTQL